MKKKIDFDKQYRRVIYFKDKDKKKKNENENDNENNYKDGGLLINLFCASLCNSSNNNVKERPLDDIVLETQTRLSCDSNNRKMYDENSIPKTRKIVFVS